ncbi:MAG: TIR domain-containing protein [Marinilabiliaceae bacterium]|nr:TIR domain-containing protein [Marinilabiliaceae bacterium]
MNHVFISYSRNDQKIADAILNNLESNGIKCWIAYRDITPGQIFEEAIVDAVVNSSIILVIFSVNSNVSRHVFREIALACDNEKVIIPFKISNIVPSGKWEYYLKSTHWLDAIDSPMEQHISKLVANISGYLCKESNNETQYKVDEKLNKKESEIAELKAEISDLRKKYKEEKDKNKKPCEELSYLAPETQLKVKDLVEINGVKWSTRNVDDENRFVSFPYEFGGKYSIEDAENACPQGWRLPTESELQSLISSDFTLTTINGIEGCLFGKGNNTIFLPIFSNEQLVAYWSQTKVLIVNLPTIMRFICKPQIVHIQDGRKCHIRCVVK